MIFDRKHFFVEGKGVVMSEPCVAAYEKESGKLVAVGRRAWDMVGKNLPADCHISR